MKTLLIYSLAAVFEIAGCFAFWAWLRLNHSPFWLVPGIISLGLFAYLLTLVPSDAAGRAYAAYGAIYITASILWLFVVEKQIPDRWDIIGMLVCLFGAGIIVFGMRPPS
jgi:small multidrug resistance family-3 protein